MTDRHYGAITAAALVASTALVAATYAYNRFYLPEQLAAQRACLAVRLMMVSEPANRIAEDARKIGHALMACRDAGHLPR